MQENVLLKPEVEQCYIATTTTSESILDTLANSDSKLVRMTVLSNPWVSTNTLKRLIDDKDLEVWKRTSILLESRK